MLTPARRLACATLAVTLIAVGGSCDSQEHPPGEEATPRSIRSENAPYRIQLPAPWRPVEPETINGRADVAATANRELYLIVLPQKLPTAPGVRRLDEEDLRRAGLEQMDSHVRGFELEHEGPVTLDGRPAISVFAEGQKEGEPIQFNATYATEGQWGFQIVAWGPGRDESALAEHVAPVLEGWRFESSPPPAADAGTPSADAVPSIDDGG